MALGQSHEKIHQCQLRTENPLNQRLLLWLVNPSRHGFHASECSGEAEKRGQLETWLDTGWGCLNQPKL